VFEDPCSKIATGDESEGADYPNNHCYLREPLSPLDFVGFSDLDGFLGGLVGTAPRDCPGLLGTLGGSAPSLLFLFCAIMTTTYQISCFVASEEAFEVPVGV